MFMLGLPFITIGSFAVWYNKYSKGKSHLVTWHGVSLVPDIDSLILRMLL